MSEISPPAASAVPVLAVIIPHYNDFDRLRTCLDALSPQAETAGEAAEIIVVDNDSPEDLTPLHAAYPWVRFLTETVKGAAAARNHGVTKSTAPHIIFLDSDCVPSANWLATALSLVGSADVTGGRVDTFDETPAPRSGAEAFETVFAFDQKTYIEEKDFSVSANLMTSRAIFEAVGPMVVGRSEDMDWCFRAVADGYKLVYRDELVVAHPTRQDWAALEKKSRRTTFERFHLGGTGPMDRVKWAITALAVAASGVAHLPKVLTSPKLANATEKQRAAVTLLRLRTARAGWMLRQALLGP